MKHKKKIGILAAICLLAALICYGLYNPLEVTRYQISDPDLPQGLEGYRIVQISDFHSSLFGEGQQEVIDLVKGEEPDLILLTGDIMDKHDQDLDRVQMLLQGLQQVAPMYAVAGNHEHANYGLYMQLQQLYRQLQVTELDDSGLSILHNGDTLYLYGIGAATGREILDGEDFSIPDPPQGSYGVLMFHFDLCFDTVAQHSQGYSLLFAGHSHGGIIRLPFIGPVLSNDGTLFPPYAGGLFQEGSLTMISSRGMGKSFLPRFYNHQELVSVTLHRG